MEGGDGDNVLEAIFDDETLDQDAEMLDAETLEEDDGQPILLVESTQTNGGDGDSAAKQESLGRSSKRRANRKKRRNKKKGSVDNVTDINRFVIDTCRHLKEKKSYLIWNAVGCLGISAVRDLIKEVDAIQGCGGQLTADANRFRTGGGVLWNILKKREPNAYKEIMARGREFEKQFRQQNIRQVPKENKEAPSQSRHASASDGLTDQVSDSFQLKQEVQHELEQNDPCAERISVHNRVRAPVCYDDLFGENVKD
ncbi:hypothetical protein MRB53_005063 [Persea americana]|uniref:Uncharacterized protein n=1 Tax=Persea americana TaxID=3435 RepID=A0ACC2MCA1_PERAE|nr:hypothetical protein MRB53_005063 [Persea americana]|eukprot:TRINITY_DN7364_c0_g2_i2.p1 TRINITY_DN7364_c0_g2~~TRINITY_DN7364_c0_g2_i2.p1  ORF type:complete len:255 (-),score=53.10 TRINITY_DN7364_c0_g2_i2:305-1069(-)